MQTRFVVLGLAVAACGSSSQMYLPTDATFLQPDVPQCLAEQTVPASEGNGDPCCQVVVFDADGEMSKLSGLEGFPGNYELDGHVAEGTVFGQDFEFDLSTGIATGAPIIAGQWIADAQDLAATACAE